MSDGYGSLRGVIGFCLVIVSALLLIGAAPVASADSLSGAGSAGSSVVAARIEPVRIIVVDKKGQITEILSNGSGDIMPSVHKGNAEGPTTALTPAISKQYAAIMSGVDQRKTGVIYKRQDDSLKPARFFNSAIVSTLLTGNQ